MPMTSCKAMTKILYGNSEKSFLECQKKNGFKKHLPALFPHEFFHAQRVAKIQFRTLAGSPIM